MRILVTDPIGGHQVPSAGIQVSHYRVPIDSGRALKPPNGGTMRLGGACVVIRHQWAI